MRDTNGSPNLYQKTRLCVNDKKKKKKKKKRKEKKRKKKAKLRKTKNKTKDKKTKQKKPQLVIKLIFAVPADHTMKMKEIAER